MLIQIPKLFFDKLIESNLSSYQHIILFNIIGYTWYRNCNSIKFSIIQKDIEKIMKKNNYVGSMFLEDLNIISENGFIDIVRNRIHIQCPDTYLTKKELGDDEKNEIFKSVIDQWNSQDILITHIPRTVSRHKSEILGIMTSAGNGDIREGIKIVNEAIFNYSTILNGTEFYYSHQFTLLDFLKRGLDRFKTSSKPLKNFLRFENRGQVKNDGSAYPKFE